MIVWNVFIERQNRIDVFNIFSDERFVRDLIGTYEVESELRRESIHRILSYYWGSRVEYEITISSYPCYIGRDFTVGSEYKPVSLSVEKKVDLCDQVMLNIEAFIEYIEVHKKEIIKQGKKR